MKKITKRIMALLIAMTMLLSVMPVQAASSERVVDIQKEAVFFKEPYINEVMAIGSYTGVKKISVKSSDTSVLTVSRVRSKWEPKWYQVAVKPKKVGKATVTVVADGKKYTCAVTIKKYEQGISYLKIGNITIPGSKLDKTNRISIKYSQIANKKLKITTRLKRGWERSSIDNQTKTKGILTFNNPVKFTGGAGGYFQFMVYNGRAGKWATIRVYVK